MKFPVAAVFCSSFAVVAVANNPPNSTISIPPQYQYLLPQSFTGNLSLGFLDTTDTNQTVNATFAQARQATFVSYDAEFDALIGTSPSIKHVANAAAYEAGIWVSNLNQVWFTSSVLEGPSDIYVLDLSTYQVFNPAPNFTTSVPGLLPIANPIGGYFFDSKIYMVTGGNTNFPASVISIDPVTYVVEEIVNSYFGLHFNGLDDLVVANCTSAGPSIFFSDTNFTEFGVNIQYAANRSAQLPTGIWRFTPSTKHLQQVVPRSDIPLPNGIAIDPTNAYLYLTDLSVLDLTAEQWGSPSIYRYTLDADCTPTNKIQFGLARYGIADGIKVDAQGRVWTAEFEGIVVRNTKGKVIGLFNQEAIRGHAAPQKINIANFALAGDKLVILGVDQVYVVTLAVDVTTAAVAANATR